MSHLHLTESDCTYRLDEYNNKNMGNLIGYHKTWQDVLDAMGYAGEELTASQADTTHHYQITQFVGNESDRGDAEIISTQYFKM